MLREDQVLKWTNFTQEVKYLVNRYCGNTHRFAPVMPPEIFAVANEVGVQGRFVENALNPVGEVINLLRFNMSFGDSQWGVTRKPDDEGKKRGRDASQDDENERGKLFPDIVLVENSEHKIRALAEIKTHWAFKPATNQTWQNFLSAKLGESLLCV